MTDKIVSWALNNRFMVVVLSLLFIAVGVEQMLKLPIDAVPDITNVQVQVLTKSPALAPLEVERLVTFPVESAMAGMPDVEEIRSTSKFGLSAVTVVFEEGTDIYRARQLVGERLVEAREAIPDGYGTPEMGPIATGLGEIYQFEVHGDPMCNPGEPNTKKCYTPMELREQLDWFIGYQLKSVPGVVEINSMGGSLKTFQVTPNPEAMQQHRITLNDIFHAIERNNRNVGGAYLVKNREQIVIRGQGMVSGLGDIRRIVIHTPEGTSPLHIKDIAAVELAPMVRQGMVTRDGKGEVVIGVAMMLMGENPREVAEKVDAKLKQLRSSLPPGVTIRTFYDRSELVNRTIGTVEKNLLEGGLLVIGVLLLMLGNLRGGLIVASAIPMAMLVAFIGMVQAKISGNLMSLGAIDFGLIVDGAVVMVENVFRLMGLPEHKGKKPKELIRMASREVARPVAFAVLIIMIVYLPILTLTGVEGKMFRPMAAAVLFALAGALVMSLTLVPVLASLFIRKAPKNHETWFVRLMHRAYVPVLDLAMRHRVWVVGIATLTFVAGAGLSATQGAEFIPKLDEGDIALQVVRLPSSSIQEAVSQTTHIEKLLLETFPKEVKSVISKTGRPEIATDPMAIDMTDVIVMLHPRSQWRYPDKIGLITAMSEALEKDVPGAAISFSQPIELRVAELIAGVRSDVAVQIYGDDLDKLAASAQKIASVVSKVSGATDVKAEQVTGLPILTAKVNHHALARYGIDADEVLAAIEALGGKQVGIVQQGERRFALQVRFPERVRRSERTIAAIPIATRDGDMIPLGELADIRIRPGAAQISRDRIQRRISVEFNVRGRDVASVVADAKQAIGAQVKLPPGYVLEWGGQFKNLERGAKRLAIVVPLALLLIFMLLYGAFGAAKPALLIFLNVPIAAVGGVFALAARGIPLSISAGVGFIALFGVAVMNGVVLVSYVRKLEQEKGLAPKQAAHEAAEVRMRPVLMTAMVASLGFLPMALGAGAGAEVQRPLATVVIGGLITATLLTLLVLPSIYPWFATKTESQQP